MIIITKSRGYSKPIFLDPVNPLHLKGLDFIGLTTEMPKIYPEWCYWQ
jgi:hypothetical protein